MDTGAAGRRGSGATASPMTERSTSTSDAPELLAWASLADVPPAAWPSSPPPAGRVDLWVVPLPTHLSGLGELRALLAPDEEERAIRFRFERHAAAHVACRGALRRLLAGYLGEDPARLRIAVDEAGKPYDPERRLAFNVAHTQGLGLLAFRDREPLGCDVEALGVRVSPEELAPRVLDEVERGELASLPVEERRTAFLRGWTRKEAFVKAVGLGLSLPLTTITVGLGRHRAPLEVHRPDLAALDLRLHPLELGPDHVGAVCTPDPAELRARRLELE